MWLLIIYGIFGFNVYGMIAPSMCQWVLTNASSNNTDDYKVPNMCYQNWESVKGQNGNELGPGYWYNYKYECNSSNTQYFIKKIYQIYTKTNNGNEQKCNNENLSDIEYYYTKDGYLFNCNNESINCIGSDIRYYCVDPNPPCDPGDTYYQFNSTSFISGQCFENINNSKSIKYECIAGVEPYNTANINKIIYNSTDCNNSTKIDEIHMASKTKKTWITISCNTPSS